MFDIECDLHAKEMTVLQCINLVKETDRNNLKRSENEEEKPKNEGK